jgi:hypothetical protein
MKMITRRCTLALTILLFAGYSALSQSKATEDSKEKNTTEMKTFLIEREIPGAGKFTPDQLKAISQTSCGVLKKMGPQIQWIHSYVTGNKIYCLYKATNEGLVKEHAKKGGFPANAIIEVASVISPATAN